MFGFGRDINDDFNVTKLPKEGKTSKMKDAKDTIPEVAILGLLGKGLFTKAQAKRKADAERMSQLMKMLGGLNKFEGNLPQG